MSEIIQDIDGNDVVVFVKFSHGLFVDTVIRAKDQATWEAAAISQGLLRIVKNTETVVISPAVYSYDEETGDRVLVKAEVTRTDPLPDTIGNVRGASIAVLGAVTLVPAELDADGNVVVPAVVDGRYHLNMRISEPMLSNLNSEGFEKWKVTAINWTTYGSDADGNSDEVGKTVSDVTLIDPATITSASLVWAGD